MANGDIYARFKLKIDQFTSQLRNQSRIVQQHASRMTMQFDGVSNSIRYMSAQARNSNSSFNRMGRNFDLMNNHLLTSIRNADRFAVTLEGMGRIISGVVVSYVFYRGAAAIKEAANELMSFNEQLELSRISFAYLTGSFEKADSYMQWVKDFAAYTPFNVEQTVNMTRRLQAMGVQASDTQGYMRTLVDTASATGGTSLQLDRIVLALGQMKTKGKIEGQELRQLAEAQIPVLQILREEMGLTTEQLRKIGELKIKGDYGVTAILAGLEKRYKGAAAMAAETVRGMKETIKDNFLIVGNEMSTGFQNSFSGILRKIRDFSDRAKEGMRKGGIGGLFEAIVPKEAQAKVRKVIAIFIHMFRSFKALTKELGPAFKSSFTSLIDILYNVGPYLAMTLRSIAKLTAGLNQSTPFVRLFVKSLSMLFIAYTAGKALLFLWSISKLGYVMFTVAKGVHLMGIALRFLWLAASTHPVAAIITIIAASVLALAATSEKATKWLNELWAKLKNFGDIDTSGLLQFEKQKDVKPFADTWEKNMQKIKDSYGEAAKSMEKDKKRWLASFDEIFGPTKQDELEDASDDLADLLNMEDTGIPEQELPDELTDLEGFDIGDFDWKDFLMVLPFIPPIIIGLKKIKKWLDNIKESEEAAAESAEKAGKKAEEAAEKTTKAKKKQAKATEEAENAIESEEESLDEFHKKQLEALRKAMKEASESEKQAEEMKKRGQSNLEALGQAFEGFAGTVKKAMENTTGYFKGMTESVSTNATFLKNNALAGLEQGFESLSSNAMADLYAMQSTALVVTGNMTTYFDTFRAFMYDNGVAFGDNIRNNFIDPMNQMQLTASETAIKVSDSLAGITDSISNAADSMKEKASSMLEGVKNAVLDARLKGIEVTDTIRKKAYNEEDFAFYQDLQEKHGKESIIAGAYAGIMDTKYLATIVAIVAGTIATLGGAAAGAGAATAAGMARAVPGFAVGGIALRENLVRVGEGSKAEAIVPLDNIGYAKPLIDAIATAVNQGNNGQQSSQQGGTINLFAMDNATLRKLERQLKVIRIKEAGRS